MELQVRHPGSNSSHVLNNPFCFLILGFFLWQWEQGEAPTVGFVVSPHKPSD